MVETHQPAIDATRDNTTLLHPWSFFPVPLLQIPETLIVLSWHHRRAIRTRLAWLCVGSLLIFIHYHLPFVLVTSIEVHFSNAFSLKHVYFLNHWLPQPHPGIDEPVWNLVKQTTRNTTDVQFQFTYWHDMIKLFEYCMDRMIVKQWPSIKALLTRQHCRSAHMLCPKKALTLTLKAQQHSVIAWLKKHTVNSESWETELGKITWFLESPVWVANMCLSVSVGYLRKKTTVRSAHVHELSPQPERRAWYNPCVCVRNKTQRRKPTDEGNVQTTRLWEQQLNAPGDLFGASKPVDYVRWSRYQLTCEGLGRWI